MDREKVIKGLEHCAKEADCRGCVYFKEMVGHYEGYKCNCMSDALALLKEQPDIVRCKDCKWYDPRCALCDNCGLPREPRFFCADGRRRAEK